mgnify:CR=1 FL=1
MLDKAVKEDDGTAIGLGGIGIYTNGLVDKLNELPLDGLSHAEYYLINAATNEYIFHPDSEKITTIAEEEFITSIINKKNNGEVCSFLSYNDESNNKCIATYNYIEEQDWIFIISDEEKELIFQKFYSSFHYLH